MSREDIAVDAGERRRLLLHIVTARPHDAAVLSRRIARPQQAIQQQLQMLMDEGAVYLSDGLRASASARVLAEAEPEELREIHDQVLAEIAVGDDVGSAVLVALAESGCGHPALFDLLLGAVTDRPDDTAALAALETVALGLTIGGEELRLRRVEAAAARGLDDLVLSLTEELLAVPVPSDRAALLAAGAHLRGNRLEQATALYRHVGIEQCGADGAWAVLASLAQGDADSARTWRIAMGEPGLTSQAAGLAHLADGLLASLTGDADAALDHLARSVSTLNTLGAELTLPESPAALAAIVAIGCGRPAVAEVLLERALRADLGGESCRRRHRLLLSWTLMVQGRIDAAERGLDRCLHEGSDRGATVLGGSAGSAAGAGSSAGNADAIAERVLCDRDLLLYWCLRAGLARRRTDLTAMREAWREIRSQTFGLRVTLCDLLPLGEALVVAARLRDSEPVGRLVQDAVALLGGIGDPVCWAAPLHWHGVQAAFQAGEPASLIPHANALVRGGQTSEYAAILATAGQTWLEVMRRETDFASVEASARALAKHGHIWDASRLAGQAALQHPDRESALSMMQLAREISKDHSAQESSDTRAAILTAREREVGRLVLDGQGYRAIGEQLFISPKTVEHHVARIRSRLSATSRGELLEKLHYVLADEER